VADMCERGINQFWTSWQKQVFGLRVLNLTMVRIDYHGNKTQGKIGCFSKFNPRPEERRHEKQRTVTKPPTGLWANNENVNVRL